MSDDDKKVMEAAERLLELVVDTSPHVSDSACVSRWAIRRIEADEAERVERAKPIDAQWLRTCGIGEWGDLSWTWCWRDPHDMSRCIECYVTHGAWTLFGERIWAQHTTTRGELLDLIRALKGGA